MIELSLDNSLCKISGLTSSQHKELKEMLSYTLDPSAVFFSGRRGVQRRSLLSSRGEFPTGLLYLVESWLDSGHTYTIRNYRIVPKPSISTLSTWGGPAPRGEQVDAAMAAVRAGRGIISMPTGTGKSVVIALLIKMLKVKTLVVVPSLELKSQIGETLRSVLPNHKPGEIEVKNVDSIDPATVGDYDMVIIDEFHHSGAKTYRTLNKKAWNQVYYKFGFTATPWRNQEHERLLLESVLSKVIYSLDYETAVEKGYIVPVEAYYVDLPKQKVEGYTYPQVYSELIVNNEYRNDIISKIIQRLNRAGKKSLCLVKEVKHGYNILRERAMIAPFVTGEDFGSRACIDLFNRGEGSSLIGTTGIIGEGVDTKPAEYIIIAGLGKSKGAFMQQCGRGMRVYPGKESCKVILFKDPSHKYTLSHFNQQVRHLRDEYGIKPVRLDMELLK